VSIVFIGFMGAGKTTAAREAAAVRGGDPIDADEVIEQRLGHSIAEEFERAGEAAFRELEAQVVCELLERAGERDVVSLGGGAVLSAAVREALARHTVVLLDIDVQRAWRRASGHRRPLAQSRAQFGKLYAARAPLYEQLADAILPAGRSVVLAPALAAIEMLQRTPDGTRLLWAASASGSYPVLVGRGLLGAEAWPIARSRRFCVSDEHVAPLYAARLGELDGSVTIPPGEGSKTLACAERVLRELARQGMARDDHLIALGGGVVGDLAGFCAATYQRGVPVVHVPTTLVAQVDSAYGGKTGVDLPEATTYVGAYHQPAAVLGDTVDDAMITACARLKLAVVAEDERDAGRRQVLNLGHTVGHAIEAATGYGRYRHGEAVALGLLAALRLSGRDELRGHAAELLAAHGLPIRLAGEVDVDAVLAATALDKKREGGVVRFVLVHQPGDVRPGAEVPAAELRQAVQELALG
jgi:shikimate kinase/3-dehydroquinate synthase